jgi:hypothetical protein
MSWLDAILGRIQSGGSDLELQGGINFTDGVEATPNPNEGRIDVRATPAMLALLPLASALRIAGVTIIEGAGSTALTNAGYTILTGAFTGSVNSDAILTASANQAAVTYSGTTAARVLVIATFGVHCVDVNQIVVHVAKNNVGAGGTIEVYSGGAYTSAATCAFIPVVTGDVIAVRATTDDAFGVTFENQQFSMIAIAIQDSVA